MKHATCNVAYRRWTKDGSLVLLINDRQYSFSNVSPYIFEKFIFTLNHNRGRALAYLHSTVGQGMKDG